MEYLILKNNCKYFETLKLKFRYLNMQKTNLSTLKAFGFFISFSFLFWSCKKSVETNPTTLDFSKYVAVGNSLTAGVSNNGLYNESIKNAYPNLIAQQLKLVGGGNFPQALFADGQENGTGYLKLKGFDGPLPKIAIENTKTAIVSIQPQKLTKYVGENQNLGMPFMKMAEIDDANIRNFNVFFDRILPDNAQSISYLQLVEKSNAKFFTCWLGNNDVLNYASSGGKAPITDKAIFTTNLKKLLSTLTKNGAKGIVANIGDVTVAPAITLLSSYRPFFTTAKFYIQTKTGVREGTKNDYLLLPANLDVTALAIKGTKISEPWADGEVLDSDEVVIAQNATKELNAIIQAEATANKLPIMDAFAFLNKLKAGITENGESVDASYLNGGIFSLDGAHLTAKGNAFTANEYIKAINAYYKSSIPVLDTKLYKGVVVE